MTTNRSIFWGLLLLTLCGRLHAQRDMHDPLRVSSLIQQYVLNNSILSQQNLIHAMEGKKQAAADEMNRMLGDTTAAHYTGTPPGVAPSADDVGLAEVRDKVRLSPEMNGYLDWQEKRRAADTAMSAQLTALTQAADGKQLDWMGHLKMQARFEQLSNQRLALSMQEANAATETRARQKDAEAEYYRQQNDAARKDEVESQVRRALQ